MHLSSIYNNMKRFVLVYHTSEGSEEIEMMTEMLFATEEAALRYLQDNFKGTDFIQCECVEVSGLNLLQLKRKTLKGTDVNIGARVEQLSGYEKEVPIHRYGRIIQNVLRRGDEVVAVEWDGNFTVSVCTLNNLRVISNDPR